MKVGDLVIDVDQCYTKPGFIVEIIQSNVFGGDAIVTVLWAGQARALKTMKSSLKKVNV